ncbi:MAG: HYR domain-containing protein, partial [Bacteroidota bacterium]
MKMYKYKQQLTLAVVAILALCHAQAQTNINMAANGPTGANPFSLSSPGNCFYNFYDSGGPSSGYSNNANASITFVPSNAATHRIQVAFSTFSLEPGYDALYIFNGVNVGTNQIPGPQGATVSGFPGGNWQNISPGIITANTGLANVGTNNEEALTFQFRSDATFNFPGWSAMVRQISKSPVNMTAPAPLTANIPQGGLNCFANVTTPLPTFVPGGSNAGYELRYRINGSAQTLVTDPLTTTIAIPVGVNIITWELTDPCGGAVIASANQIITVNDNSKPAIVCPANISLNLPSGECSGIANYNVTCSDNCTLGTQGIVNHPIDFNKDNAGIMFNLKNLGSNTITITQFGTSLDAGTWPMEVYFTHTAASWQGVDQTPGAWTQAGSITVTSTSPTVATPIPGFEITLAPGQSRGIYVTSIIGAPLNCTEVSRSKDDGVLQVSANPGAGKQYPFAQTDLNRAFNGYVRYTTSATLAPVQISGIPSGSKFPIGTTVNTFKCTDPSGNSATCSFSVNVSEFVPTGFSLTCFGQITVSLGDNCQEKIGADRVLIGGAYRCYDYYKVEIDRTPPLGNGPWELNIINAADIGKTVKVRVTEPASGTKCQSDASIVDATPPKLKCPTQAVSVPCNFPTKPEYVKNTTLSARFSAKNLPAGGQKVLDFQTVELIIPVPAVPGSVVNDIDFRTQITGAAFNNNLRIQMVSPSGTVINLWDQLGGCPGTSIFTRFDDEGLSNLTCAAFSTDTRNQIPFSFGRLSAFDGALAAGDWKIRISDLNGNADTSIIKLAELYIQMTGPLTTGFPNNLPSGTATVLGNNTYSVPAGFIDDCSAATLTYFDQSTNQSCSSQFSSIISRRWTATDQAGISSTCYQTINLLRATYADVTAPPSFNGIDKPVFACSSQYPTPDWIAAQGMQGSPLLYGLPDNCQMSFQYVDQLIPVCNGAFHVTRNWTVLDPCSGPVTLTFAQSIFLEDQEAPTFKDLPVNLVRTTDPLSNCATFKLPPIKVVDNCSKITQVYAIVLTLDPFSGDTTAFIPVTSQITIPSGNPPGSLEILATFGTMPCIPLGVHTVVYFATDDCGNKGIGKYTLTIADFAPPTASCDQTTVVAIGNDDPNDCYTTNPGSYTFAGITWVNAKSFDNGSYDVNGPVKFTVRRQAPYSACITALNHNPCSGNPGGKSEYNLAIAEADSIKFYCCEVGTTQKVILRVYKLKDDGSIATYPNGNLIFNECIVDVNVQDQLPPAIEAPPNLTVDCGLFDPTLASYGNANVSDNCCLDVSKEYLGKKGIVHSFDYTDFDTTCNRGTIVRTFRAFDCKGASSVVTQRIVVSYKQDYWIKFPDDKIITVCNGTGVYGEPVIFGEDCELLGITYVDQVYTVVPDACYKIERNWKIVNWCTYNPQGSCINVPNPTPNINSNHASNLPGPIVSPPGTGAPWTATVTKVYPNDPVETDYSSFWSASANCYTYKQIIKVIDAQAPVITCPTTDLDICDITTNNLQLWNDSGWFDQGNQSHNLCEGTADLSISATDLCSGSDLTIRYLLFLDLNGDGVQESVVSSPNPPQPGTIQYNNINTPNFSGGTTIAFDQRPESVDNKYQFDMQVSKNGTQIKATVKWNTQTNPDEFFPPQLPLGTHKIKWIVSDGCGNEGECGYNFTIRDCAAPTVLCTSPLSVNIGATGLVSVFAKDFLLDVEDNCTLDDHLKLGARVAGSGTGFPQHANLSPIDTLTFTCNDLGLQPIELWVKDLAGKTSFCQTSILVQDNQSNCNTTQASVAGALKTETDEGLEDGTLVLAGQSPAGVAFSFTGLSDQTGAYIFHKSVPVSASYTITPSKDDNPLNGLSTYDLVLISKHILGLQPLGSPYKMIAADANMSNSITTFDIVEFRKMILGIYTDLPANTSWRFVDKSFIFTNPNNPFNAPFPEFKSVASLQGDALNDNFVAIKVGDVNNTAMANSLMDNESRSTDVLLFDADDRTVKSGETFEVKFKAAELVSAYQFTLNYPGLQLLDILPGEGLRLDNFADFAEEHALTSSWNGDVDAEFTLTFKALQNGALSKMLAFSSRITSSEAYRSAGGKGVDVLNVGLRFNSPGGSVISGVGFELFQNQPNPFSSRTKIGFHLPAEARSAQAGAPNLTTVTLTIYDQSGRKVHTQKGEFQ